MVDPHFLRRPRRGEVEREEILEQPGRAALPGPGRSCRQHIPQPRRLRRRTGSQAMALRDTPFRTNSSRSTTCSLEHLFHVALGLLILGVTVREIRNLDFAGHRWWSRVPPTGTWSICF